MVFYFAICAVSFLLMYLAYVPSLILLHNSFLSFSSLSGGMVSFLNFCFNTFFFRCEYFFDRNVFEIGSFFCWFDMIITYFLLKCYRKRVYSCIRWLTNGCDHRTVILKSWYRNEKG